VVAELNGDSDSDSPAATAPVPISRLTPQQRAWLKLVQPLTIVEGFALVVGASSFVQNEIERHLRTQIVDALSAGSASGGARRCGSRHRDSADDDGAGPDLPSVESDLDEVDEDREALASAHESWPTYFTERPRSNTSADSPATRPEPPVHL